MEQEFQPPRDKYGFPKPQSEWTQREMDEYRRLQDQTREAAERKRAEQDRANAEGLERYEQRTKANCQRWWPVITDVVTRWGNSYGWYCRGNPSIPYFFSLNHGEEFHLGVYEDTIRIKWLSEHAGVSPPRLDDLKQLAAALNSQTGLAVEITQTESRNAGVGFAGGSSYYKHDRTDVTHYELPALF